MRAEGVPGLAAAASRAYRCSRRRSDNEQLEITMSEPESKKTATQTDLSGDDQGSSEVSRRRFLGLGAAAGAATLAGLGSACAPAGSDDQGGTGLDAGEDGGFALPHPELEEVTLDRLQAGMASGEWTSEQVTRAYLDRIAAGNLRGPELRAVIETNPDALSLAAGLDQERAEGRVRGPLHGVPVLLKDNIDTADGMTTTAGSLALEGSTPSRDAFIVERLREAGAIVLGKANLSEWANFRSTRSSSGWSGRGGQCRNPFALDRNPCGSSSGSGAGVSANFTALAIGTETNGSVVCPSSASGVVGIKPTVGLWSRSGIIPISVTQDTAGPMCRTVRDATILLGACTGIDPRDSHTQRSEGHASADYTPFLDAQGLRGARIGIVRDTFGSHEGVTAILEEAMEVMRAAGADLVDPVEIPDQGGVGGVAYQTMLYEFKAGLNEYFASLGPDAPVRTLEDVIAFNEANADRSMPYFQQEIMLLAQEKGPLSEQAYLDGIAEKRRRAGPEGIDRVMNEHNLDALFGPTGGPAWVTDLVNGDNYSISSSSPAAISGYPNVTVPAGFVFGMPVGVSFWGREWSEGPLIRIAYAFEQATLHRRAPGFLPTADLTI
jgi:amidase